jgi:hypothetical protein
VGDSLLQPKTKKARINPMTSATPLPIIYDPQTMEKVGPRQDPLPSSVVAESSSFKPASAETFIPPPSNTGQPSAILTKPRISQVPPPSVVEETSSIKPASVEQFVPPPSNAGQPSALLTEPRISQVPPPFVVETSSFKSVSVEKFVPPSSDSGHPPALLTKPRISQVLPPSDVETSSFKSASAKQFVPPPGNVGRPSALLTKPRRAQQAPAHPITQTPLASSMSPEYDFPLHDEISLLEPLIVDLLARTGARVTEHLIGSVKERCESLVDEISQQCLRILQPQIDGIATTAVQSLQPTLSSMNVRPRLVATIYIM